MPYSRCVRYFNTEGPVDPTDHYCIPALERVDYDEILQLIHWKKYFILHAPRQTGKTSTLKALADRLNAAGKYRCVYVNVEPGQSARQDVAAGMQTILAALADEADWTIGEGLVEQIWPVALSEAGPHLALKRVLARWSAADSKPLVLFIDEIDSLIGDTLLSVLRQLRSGYPDRPRRFPQSIILCGVRDVRNYRIFSSSEGTHISGGSAFNIKAESLRLGDFTQAEVWSLLGQHTAETGQQFEAGVRKRIWHLTRGQPWLVNALALRACFKDKTGRVRSQPICLDAIDRAKETLILNRVTHLDQLANQVSEQRVRRVILPMIAGSVDARFSPGDLEYVRDLGLVAGSGSVRMANPIYAEVIPRELTLTQASVLESLVFPSWYVNDDGSLDLPKLMAAFQDHFRQHSEFWVQRYGHREAGPHLVLHTYLHRVVNSGGRITREYAVGRRRTDLLIEWPRPGGTLQSNPSKHVIECRVLGESSGLESVIREGSQQTEAYMDLCGAESGHLVIFDMRPGKTWKERIYMRDPEPDQPAITVWGM